MSTPTLAPTRNGHKPASITRLIPRTGSRVDQLLELRALLKEAEATERDLTREILDTMRAQGLRALHGSKAVAVLEARTCLKPDPELFLQALGPAAYPALTVSVTAARKLMPADELAAISETTTVPTLRVEALATPTA